MFAFRFRSRRCASRDDAPGKTMQIYSAFVLAETAPAETGTHAHSYKHSLFHTSGVFPEKLLDAEYESFCIERRSSLIGLTRA
jgi:hypothetical protein